MKIFYIASIRLPTERAHGLQVMKMCEAFSAKGAEVELLVPERPNSMAGDPFTFYGIKPTFTIKTVAAIDTSVRGKSGFWLHRLMFSIRVLQYLRKQKTGVIYSRDELPLWLLSFVTTLPMVFEAHEGRWNIVTCHAVRGCRFIVVISKGLQDFFKNHGVPPDKIVLAPDGVDYELFAGSPASNLRQELRVEADVPLVMYTGHLFIWKGADVLAQAAHYLPDALFIFIGGTERDLQRFRAAYGTQPNVRILGWRPYATLPGHMCCADVLVLPNSAKKEVSRLYTSPLKLFEYMAAGKPIVASDIASIREVLDETCAYFAAPDDPRALAKVLSQILADPAAGRKRAAAAQERALRFTWQERASTILARLP